MLRLFSNSNKSLIFNNKFDNINKLSKYWIFKNNKLHNSTYNNINLSNFFSSLCFYLKYKIFITNNSLLLSKFKINYGYLEFILNFNHTNDLKLINICLFNDKNIIDIFRWESDRPAEISNYLFNNIYGYIRISTDNKLLLKNNNIVLNNNNKYAIELTDEYILWLFNDIEYLKIKTKDYIDNLEAFNIKIIHYTKNIDSILNIEEFNFYKNSYSQGYINY